MPELADQPTGPEAAVLQQGKRHPAGGQRRRRVLVAVVLGDLGGHDRWVGTKTRETLTEGRLPLRTGMKDAIMTLGIIETVAERAIGAGVAPVRPLPRIRLAARR
jgi:hypothetical protein